MSNILLLQATSCCSGEMFSCCWIWWMIWTLGAFLLGALLHWLFFCKKKQEEIDRLTRENEGLRADIINKDKDIAGYKYQIDESTKHIQHLKAQLSSCQADKAILAAKISDGGDSTTQLGVVAPTSRGTEPDYAALLGNDNHQIIEGIGPKIDGLMKAAGIMNWADMASSSVERLQGVLNDAGARYKLANPSTWPRQAQLATEAKWDDLIEYQKFLGGGVEGKGDLSNDSKFEKLLVKKLGFSTNPEDLKIVEGVGPKIEGLLKDAGIQNWTDLGNATTDRLSEVLAAAGARYKLADPSTWPKQAKLAAEGNWDELKEYQDFLDGGKTPV